METELRALYNSLRMNWLLDPNVSIQPWQVEDYRSMPLEALFARLKLQDFDLNRSSFVSLADQFDTPEDLTNGLLADSDADEMTHDQVYLLVFELWRRLLPEKPCLSVFCDELDHQIHLYDSGRIENPEGIQDALANLQVVLDENTDAGNDPVDVFESICGGCANDVESFLYDYIAEQIEESNEFYAAELLDDFADYVSDVKWFDFLRVKLLETSNPEEAVRRLRKIIQDAAKEKDLEFNLDVLAYLVQAGDKEDFVKLVKSSVPLLTSEEDFQDLLTICADFYHRLDRDEVEEAIQNIIKKRSVKGVEATIDRTDPDIAELFTIMK